MIDNEKDRKQWDVVLTSRGQATIRVSATECITIDNELVFIRSATEDDIVTCAVFAPGVWAHAILVHETQAEVRFPNIMSAEDAEGIVDKLNELTKDSM